MAKYTLSQISVVGDVLRIRLRPEGRQMLRFQPGQYAALSFIQDGRPTPSRCFSIVSSPLESELEFGIRVQGDYTKMLAGLELGTSAIVQGPFGEFTLDWRYSDPVVLLAAGIGITPYLSMLRAMVSHPPAFSTTLIYCVRTLETAPYRAEIDQLASQIANLRVIYFASEATSVPPVLRNVVAGALTPDYLRRIMRDEFAHTVYYLCGPTSFMKAYTQFLLKQGVETDRVYSESFTQAVKPAHGPSMARLAYGLTAGALVLATSTVMVMDVMAHTATADTTTVPSETTQTETAMPTSEVAPTVSPSPTPSSVATPTPVVTPAPVVTPTPVATPSPVYRQPRSSVS